MGVQSPKQIHGTLSEKFVIFFKKIKCSEQPKKQNKLNFYFSHSGVPNVRVGWVGSQINTVLFLTPSLTNTAVPTEFGPVLHPVCPYPTNLLTFFGQLNALVTIISSCVTRGVFPWAFLDPFQYIFVFCLISVWHSGPSSPLLSCCHYLGSLIR